MSLELISFQLTTSYHVLCTQHKRPVHKCGVPAAMLAHAVVSLDYSLHGCIVFLNFVAVSLCNFKFAYTILKLACKLAIAQISKKTRTYHYTWPKKRLFRALDSLLIPNSANPLLSASYPFRTPCSNPVRIT